MNPVLAGFFALLFLALAASTSAGEDPSWREVTFASADGGTVSADLYPGGGRGVVLAHGAVFDKESWRPLALELQKKGMTVLPIDFRGYGASRAGKEEGALHLDVLAAVAYLKEHGARTVAVVGGSMGGGAAARAAAAAKEGEIDRMVLLSPVPVERPEDMRAGSLLVVVSRGERLFPRVKQQFERAPEPKRLEVLDGDAHAQNIFATEQGPRLTAVIVAFLEGDGTD